MKNILLDTHSLIYLGLFPDRLNPKVHKAIEAAAEVYCSDISLWEISMLLSKGRIIIESPTELFLEDLIAAHGIEVLAVTPAIAAASQKWALKYKEPSILIIAATAFCYDITLVSKDPVFSEISEIKTIW